MPKITPKSPELIEAQVAAFASERQGGGHILLNLGELATGNLRDYIRTTESDDFGDAPVGTEVTIATAPEYIDFLRSVGGSKNEAIQTREEMLTRYNQEFKPIIDNLQKEVQDPRARKEHPAFMGDGSNAAVFRITREGKNYAVRVPNGHNPVGIDRHIAGAVLGKGIPHFEQIVAASYEDSVTVAEIMPGKELAKDMSIEDVEAITDGQLLELVDTLTTATRRGIKIDPKPSNIFYDREFGFGIVDYQPLEIAGSHARQDLGTLIGWMAIPLLSPGFYGAGFNRKITAGAYLEDANRMLANLDVLKRYRVVVEDKLDGEEQETALKAINSRIESQQKEINDYLNPEFIAKRIAKDAERK